MDRKDLLNIALEEYKSLRDEVVNSVDRQYALANWSISAMAILVASVVAAWGTLQEKPVLVAALAMFLFPAILTGYVIAWSHVITKISQLGRRLFEIENNLAHIIKEEEIRSAFRLKPSEDVNPFRYLLGWEHHLWDGTNNARVNTTSRSVLFGVAIAYFLGVSLGTITLICLSSGSGFVLVSLVTATSLILWSSCWLFVRKYLTTLFWE